MLQGFLILADISGYTRFLKESELDHAQGILQELLGAMIERLQFPLVLSSVRGDAVVCHAPVQNIPAPPEVLDAIEGVYIAFRATLVHMQRNTTCPCAACKGMDKLGLKMIVHFGEYVVQELAGRPELHGTDVVTAFRLLKNEVIAATGITAYLAYTAQAAEAFGAPDYFGGLVSHTQDTEDCGEVQLRVADMEAVWQRHAALERVVVEAEDPQLFEEVRLEIPAPPSHVYDVVVSPELRPKWFPLVDQVKVEGGAGRSAAGVVHHCAHSDGSATVYTIMDARPGEHLTFDVHLPIGGGRLRASIVTDAGEAGGTLVRVRLGRPVASNGLVAMLLRFMLSMAAKKERASWVLGLSQLRDLVAQQVAAQVAVSSAKPSAEELAEAAQRRIA